MPLPAAKRPAASAQPAQPKALAVAVWAPKRLGLLKADLGRRRPVHKPTEQATPHRRRSARATHDRTEPTYGLRQIMLQGKDSAHWRPCCRGQVINSDAKCRVRSRRAGVRHREPEIADRLSQATGGARERKARRSGGEMPCETVT